MRFAKTAAFVLVVAGVFVGVSASPSEAQARNLQLLQTTHKVQVEYWFWDSDYYYWSTVFESSDFEDAQFVYELLLTAKKNGQLNQVAPNEYWKYIAVDVRLITEHKYPIQFKPIGFKLDNNVKGATIR